NKLFKQLNDIDNSDWIPPAILYLSRNYSHPERLVQFFTELERLAAGLMIKRANINERIERYRRLLTAIEHEEDLYTPDSPLQITSEEKNDILKMLDGDLYLTQKIRLFVLLRLDAALSEGEASYNFPTITVEHILPQNPAHDSLWVKWFPSLEKREKYVHRLGNLALLSCWKNSEAQNYDFEVKKQKYFTTKKGVSPFALTTQVLMEQEWTPEVIETRQKKLIGVLKKVWRLE
ncbi:MAG: HNH endonuclease family protein, partial [Cyanobacteriota bacterium]